MTIILTKPVRVGGVELAAATTQTFAADVEADLVSRASAAYTINPTIGQGGVPVMADINNLTGGIEYFSTGNRIKRIYSPRKGREFKGSYGRRIFIGTSLHSTAGTAILVSGDLPPAPDSSSNTLRITQSSGQSYAQWVCESGDFTPAAKENVAAGLWVRNESGNSLSMQLLIYAVNTAHQFRWNFTVDPSDGWVFITLPHSQMDYQNFTWGTHAIHFCRLLQRDAGGDVWPAGASVDVGPVYLGVKARPRFMLASDDCLSTNYHPVNSTTRPASGGSFKSIVQYYGFQGSMYCIPSKIGTTGYLTQRELLEIQDLGWSIGSHSYSHPAYSSRGLTSLGPVGFADPSDPSHSIATNDDTAILADLVRGIEGCRDLGVYNPDLYFALPQGAWDASVRSACIKAGFKHVRATSLLTNVRTLSIGLPSGSNNTGSTLQHGGWIHQADALSTDAETYANMVSYIDSVIAQGSTGASYSHGMTIGNVAIMDQWVAYLKTKVDAGLIDVVTLDEVAHDDGLV